MAIDGMISFRLVTSLSNRKSLSCSFSFIALGVRAVIGVKQWFVLEHRECLLIYIYQTLSVLQISIISSLNQCARFMQIPVLIVSHVQLFFLSLTVDREISTLLARSFFMGFSLTVLALLARIRVLVQQMLLDVVCVFNSVSSLSQKEQAIKLTQDGFEVFREYFPQKQQVVFLECIWESDKYVLVERPNEKDVGCQEKESGEDVSVEASKIQYESIEIFLGDDEPGKTASKDSAEDGQTVSDKDKAKSLDDPIAENNDESRAHVGSAIAGPSGNNFDAPESGALPSSSPNKNPAKAKPGSRNNVAFVSVKRPKVTTNNELGFGIHGTEKGDTPGVDKEDPFFSLLISGNMKSSLF